MCGDKMWGVVEGSMKQRLQDECSEKDGWGGRIGIRIKGTQVAFRCTAWKKEKLGCRKVCTSVPRGILSPKP